MSKDIKQYHYTMWPDHGTPEPLNLAVFHNEILRTSADENTTPMVVHCRYKFWYLTWKMTAFKCRIHVVTLTVLVLNNGYFEKLQLQVHACYINVFYFLYFSGSNFNNQ